MRKFLKWTSIVCLVAGVVIGSIGILNGGLSNVDFFYWTDFVKNIKIF